MSFTDSDRDIILNALETAKDETEGDQREAINSTYRKTIGSFQNNSKQFANQSSSKGSKAKKGGALAKAIERNHAKASGNKSKN